MALVFLHKLALLEFQDRVTARRVVYYIAVFPTTYFFSAVYTESIFLVFFVSSIYFARRRRWLLAGSLGFIASATRVTGILVWGFFMLEWFRSNGWTLGSMIRKEAWSGMWKGFRREWIVPVILLITPLGLLSYMLFLQVKFGDPFVFLTTQEAWGREQIGLLVVLEKEVLPLFQQDYLNGRFSWHVIVDGLSMLAVLVATPFIWRRLGEGYALLCLISILLPGLSSTMSMSRYILVLFPLFMILGHWGRNETLDRILMVGFSMLLGIFTVFNACWIFVA